MNKIKDNEVHWNHLSVPIQVMIIDLAVIQVYLFFDSFIAALVSGIIFVLIHSAYDVGRSNHE